MIEEAPEIESIKKAARVIRQGGLVAFPTETVYGLGANALDPVAVARIFEAKERPSFDPLIVHVASLDTLARLTKRVDAAVFRLVEAFWPGPLTVVLPKNDLVPDIVTSGLSTVGIRMPDNKMALQLIRESGCPIAAPSANKFGQLSPVTAYHVKKQLPTIDYILDGGPTTVGIESTIVAVTGNTLQLLRPGYITLDDIEDALPGVFRFKQEVESKLMAPGLMKSHYSPRKPLYILEGMPLVTEAEAFALTTATPVLPPASGLILHSQTDAHPDATRVIYTSNNRTLTEVAGNLFAALHAMEEDGSIRQMYIESVPETGLGVAIMDRLKKAAYRYQNQ